MRLVFDAFELTPHSAKSKGIYSYALQLCGAMAGQLRPGETMDVVCHGENAADFRALGLPPSVRLYERASRMPGRLQRVWWSQFGAALWTRGRGVDAVYLSPKGFTPGLGRRLTGLRTVCVIHDLIPLWYLRHHPAHFGRLEGWLVKAGLMHSVRAADGIVAISEATAAALREAGAEVQRVSVVYNGVPPLPAPALQPGHYIMALASSLPHKNLAGVLAAYADYRQHAGPAALPLKLVGVAGAFGAGVEALGTVSAETLSGLYAHAQAFLFLSHIEGFGFPPLEALRAGAPVVCSDIAAHRELCAGLATLVPADDPGAAAAALWEATRVAEPEGVRRERAQAMAARVAHELSWTRCAAGVLRVVRRVARSGGQVAAQECGS